MAKVADWSHVGRPGDCLFFRVYIHYLVGAKYVGCISTGLASVFSVDLCGCMSIPRNLVSWGGMDPGSIPASSVTSVAGALGTPA